MSFKKTIIIVCSIIVVTLSILLIWKKEEKKFVNIEFIDGFDNSIITLQKVQLGKTLNAPNNPKHDDYVFVGWFKEDEEHKEFKDFTNIKENLRLIAHYDIDKNNNGIVDTKDKMYKVTFVDNITQDILDTQLVLSSTNAKAPVIPNHEGYVFLGWNKGYTDVKNDIVVTTNFKEEIIEETDEKEEHDPIFIVTFIDGDTGNVFTIQNVQEGMSASLPESPSHENRVFKGWIGEYRNITSNKTITAEYTNDLNNDGIADNLQPLEEKM